MQGQARSQGIARSDLQQRDLSVEGRELVQARADMAFSRRAALRGHSTFPYEIHCVCNCR
jgi:hypothetical protein